MGPSTAGRVRSNYRVGIPAWGMTMPREGHVSELKLGVIAHTHKENEFRLPIHPEHFERIDSGVIGRVYLEHGYGEHFGISDDELATSVAGLRSREQLIA